MKRYISILPMLFVVAIGMAHTSNDTINRMVLVESTYNPIIVGAVKRNFIPEEVKPSMNKEKVVYANENVDLTTFDREALSAPVVGIVSEEGASGYAHLGYGNYNDLSGMAAYKWRFNVNNDLALKAHIDGWNGKFKLEDGDKWRSHLYDMGVNADYNASLDDVSLNVGAHGVYYNYNYLSGRVQNANSLGAHVGVSGFTEEQYKYDATISYTRFGRSTYFDRYLSHSENHINGKASLEMNLSEWGMALVRLNGDVLTYQGLTDYHGLISLGITPQWSYQHGDLHFVTGFNMDFIGGNHIDHPLQFSPECSISFVPENRFSALLTLDGGRKVNTFSRLHELSPYWGSTEQLRPTYTFLNAHLDGGVRVIEGLHLHLGGGYKIVSNALFEMAGEVSGVTYTGVINHNAQVASVDGGISYAHRDLVAVSVKSAYSYWMLHGDQNLLSRAPLVDTDVDARVRIMPNLHAYTNLKWVAFTDADERSIIDWSLGAHYALNKQFTFFFDAHNLLNRRYSYYTGYPAQGFNVLAGAIFKF